MRIRFGPMRTHDTIPKRCDLPGEEPPHDCEALMCRQLLSSSHARGGLSGEHFRLRPRRDAASDILSQIEPERFGCVGFSGVSISTPVLRQTSEYKWHRHIHMLPN